MARAQTTFPIMRQEFRLVGRHIDVDRTIALTPLAGETQVQRFLYVVIAPPVGDDVAVQHLPKVMRAAARRVPLLVRHHVAWAHGVIVGVLSLFSAAFAYADAAQRSV